MFTPRIFEPHNSLTQLNLFSVDLNIDLKSRVLNFVTSTISLIVLSQTKIPSRKQLQCSGRGQKPDQVPAINVSHIYHAGWFFDVTSMQPTFGFQGLKVVTYWYTISQCSIRLPLSMITFRIWTLHEFTQYQLNPTETSCQDVQQWARITNTVFSKFRSIFSLQIQANPRR